MATEDYEKQSNRKLNRLHRHITGYLPGWRNMTNEKRAESQSDFLISILEQLGIEIQDATILDIGAGNGLLVQHLRDIGVDSHGIDDEPGLTAKKKKLVKKGRVEKMQKIFADESFDVVTSTAVFDETQYKYDERLMMEEIARVLKPGGLFVVFGSGPNNPHSLVEAGGIRSIAAKIYEKHS